MHGPVIEESTLPWVTAQVNTDLGWWAVRKAETCRMERNGMADFHVWGGSEAPVLAIPK